MEKKSPGIGVCVFDQEGLVRDGLDSDMTSNARGRREREGKRNGYSVWNMGMDIDGACGYSFFGVMALFLLFQRAANNYGYLQG